MKQKTYYIVITVIGFVLLSCEKKQDHVVDSVLESPLLISSTLRSSNIHLDTSSGSHVIRLPNGNYTITDSIVAVVTHISGVGSIRRVYYSVLRPNSSDKIASGELQHLTNVSADTAQFSSPISFTIQRSEVGTYRIVTLAIDRWNNYSNSIILTLTITKNNSKPYLYNLAVPDTIVRPASGIKLFTFSVAVSDSDGYKDVKQVYFQRIFPSPSSIFMMYDDGSEQSSGDRLAGDGIFSRIVRIDSTALLGSQTFLFQARDNSEALSDSLLHTITIVQ